MVANHSWKLSKSWDGLSTRLRNVTDAESGVQVNLTTNGTVATGAAWQVMGHPLVMLSVSHDGLPEVHDLHRVTGDGHGSAATVDSTLHELIAERREFNVVMVVRPDTVEQLPDGISYLYDLGVRQITPSLDLWTQWTRADADKLRIAIAQAADFWAEHYPHLAISWFDEKAAHLAKIPIGETARCQFGSGQIAVSPAGNLYPCERLIGEDKADNPMRLQISLSDATDFASTKQFPEKSSEICDSCVLNTMCGTSCRCSNYIRTGDVQRPDGLLCLLEAASFQEVARVATTKQREPVSATKQCEVHHVGV